MTVKELVDLLLDKAKIDDEVRIEVPTGNHWGQVQAMEISKRRSDRVLVAFSGYLNGDEVLDDEQVEDSEVEKRTVFLLRG